MYLIASLVVGLFVILVPMPVGHLADGAYTASRDVESEGLSCLRAASIVCSYALVQAAPVSGFLFGPQRNYVAIACVLRLGFLAEPFGTPLTCEQTGVFLLLLLAYESPVRRPLPLALASCHRAALGFQVRSRSCPLRDCQAGFLRAQSQRQSVLSPRSLSGG